jgi:hypothetical protein
MVGTMNISIAAMCGAWLLGNVPLPLPQAAGKPISKRFDGNRARSKMRLPSVKFVLYVTCCLGGRGWQPRDRTL